MEENSVFVVATCNCINTRRMLRATLLVVLFVVGLSDGSAVLRSEFNEEDTLGDDSNVKEDDPSQLIPETQSLLTCKQMGITFWLYRSKNDPGVELQIGDNSICGTYSELRNKSIPTLTLCHGYLGSRTAEFVRVITNAYYGIQNNNFIVLDYSGFALGLLAYGPSQAKVIGGCLADLLNTLIQNGCLDLPTHHMIGFSLGAQAAGVAGLRLSGQIGRITGLDPAGPLFPDCSNSLNTIAAGFVDCVHTSMELGTTNNCCHQDYYVNGAKDQPECKNMLGQIVAGGCDHATAFRDYSYSVTNPTAFPAWPCGSVAQAIDETCPIGPGPATNFMGYLASDNPTSAILQVTTTIIVRPA